MTSPPDRPATLAAGEAALPVTSLELAAAALASDEVFDARFELVEPGFIGVRSPRGRVALLEYQPSQPQRWQSNLGRVRSGAYPARYVLVLGGGAALQERVQASADAPDAGPRWLAHAADGELWQSRAAGWRERGLVEALAESARQAFARDSWSSSESEALYRRLQHDLARSRDEARQLDGFRDHALARKPIVTSLLVALIAIVFGLQALWGGVDLPPLLTRMGSLVPERLRAGEWWRYFACTFLHGGVLHVGLNTLVLWMLGRSLERFIGSARFMLIYFAAGLAGSFTSSLFVSSQSVGASGAIWGLLGAEAAMAFYPRPLLPPVLVDVARRTAAANLALNLVNSFNPHVDLAAHVGGGLTGAAVLVLLALSGQLPAFGRPRVPLALGLRVLAGLLGCAFLVGLVTSLVMGQPWRLAQPPELERVPLPGSPWTLTVPRQRSAPAEPDDGAGVEFGNLAFDPWLIDVSWALAAPGDPDHAPELEAGSEQLAIIQRQLERVPEGLEVISPASVQTAADGSRFITVRYRYASNVEIIDERVIGLRDQGMVRVDVIAWAALPGSFEGLALRILASLEPARPSP